MINSIRRAPPPTISHLERAPRPESTAARFPAASPAPEAPSARGTPAADASRDGPIRRLLVDVDRQRAQVDRAIAQAARGRSFSPSELLVLQARVYAYSESLEVVSHLLDRTVSAIKTTLNTQV